MRFFTLEPGSGPIAEALERISPDLIDAGARKAVLIVEEEDGGVQIAVGRAPGYNGTAKETTDMLLRVALDAKSLAEPGVDG